MVRIKHRYLLLNILYPQPIPTTKPNSSTPSQLLFHAPTPSYLSPGLLISHLKNHISTHFGDTALGLTQSSLKCVYLSPATSTAIIRCPRAHMRIVWASLSYMMSLPGPRRNEVGMGCVVRVVRVSGTIRKSEEELIKRARVEVVRAKEMEEKGQGDVQGRLIGSSKEGGSVGLAVQDSIYDEDMYDDLESEEE
jgi:ribonuclease P/MRP protein subunit POP5